MDRCVGELSCCGYVSPFDGYHCEEPVWVKSNNGVCLGHSTELNKPKDRFLKLLQTRLKEKNYNFDGFVFSSRLIIKDIELKGVVSFIGSTFQKGLLFKNIKMLGDQIRFDQCWFEDGDLLFDNCVFSSSKISFVDSALTAKSLLFRNCTFQGSQIEFNRAQWRSSKHIAFINCTFKGKKIDFSNMRLKAPEISFSGSSFHCKQLDFDRTELYANRFALKQVKLLRGEALFSKNKIECKQLDFSNSLWLDKGLKFNKLDWKGETANFDQMKTCGDGLSILRSRFIGDSISFEKINIENSRFHCSDSKIELKKSLCFNSSKIIGRFNLNHCKIRTPEFYLNHIDAQGNEFSIQSNQIESNHFQMKSSIINTTRTSFTRSKFDSNEIDFSYTQFKGMQLSFQAVTTNADTIQFLATLFDSRRTAFNRTTFFSRKTTFNRANFGSGVVTFWKTKFSSNIDFNDTRDRGAHVHFNTDLSNVRWNQTQLSRCFFHDSTWEVSGWMKRICAADEPTLLARNEHESLQKVYSWIADNYGKTGQKRLQKEFLFSCKEIERMGAIRKRFIPMMLKMEILRWTTGYGLGVPRIALIRGACVNAAAILALFIKMR
jgi:hypothetical protein